MTVASANRHDSEPAMRVDRDVLVVGAGHHRGVQSEPARADRMDRRLQRDPVHFLQDAGRTRPHPQGLRHHGRGRCDSHRRRIQDAHNLVRNLAAARRVDGTEVVDRLLRSYEAERRPVAQALVRATAWATGLPTAGDSARRRFGGVAPLALAPLALARSAVQARLGPAVGMLENAYPPGPLTAAAPPSGGRVPTNPALRDGGGLYQGLEPLGHTLMVRQRPGGLHPDPDDPLLDSVPLVVVPDDALAEPVRDLPRVALIRPVHYLAFAGDTVDEIGLWVRWRMDLIPLSCPKGRRG
ncbi:FAD-dependent monooxygenase [Micromonospora purpureochromogenes]|uniref:FAD-dependent monooxygenase n=1 Tax=Micromonospora purpureochromogenes TaxID=47872 RepID=UPI0033304356